ncbi:hypothetical protein QCA50_007516 [Cerrena zonata]|uniref:Uncharacterized protein n=1 Tax=Cerrena zonata TaxID=2478898 RepID=A0AAW0GFV6_9APHY
MTATPINPNLTSSLDSLPLSDFVPYLLVASASTCGAFIWQTTRYLREASLTRKSHLPFGTFVLVPGTYRSQWNYSSLSVDYGVRFLSSYYLDASNPRFESQVWDLRAAYGVQSFNISTIREWFLYHIAASGFVFSFLFVTIIVSRLFEMRVDKSSEEQDKYPLTSYALDRCSLQFGEVPVSNTHRTLSYLSGMFRLPSLLWTLATFCVYLFNSKLNDSLGVLVLRVACSVAGALVSPVILVKGLRKLGDADSEAERVEIVEREMKKGVEGPKGF